MKPDPNRLLRLLLRANGVAMLLALIPAAVPASWLADAHQRLGLGPFPPGPVVVYLARSVSLLYALLGGLLLLLANDLVRYRPAIAYVAWALIALGAAVTLVGCTTGLPLWWTAAEGPITIADGIAVLVLKVLGRRREGKEVGPSGIRL